MTTGAWADNTVTWTGLLLESVNVSSNEDVKTQTIDGITVTANNGYFKYFSGDDLVIAAPYALSTNGLVFSATVNILSVEVTTSSTNSTFAGNSGSETSHTYTLSPAAKSFVVNSPDQWYGITKIVFTLEDAAPAGPEVTYNDAKTEASFAMPAYDATVSYELVRDVESTGDAALTFVGVPTEPVTVKKGQDGKFQPATAFDFKLNDPLVEGDDKNILSAEGLTVSVLKAVKTDATPGYTFEGATTLTLAEFLADTQPGTYKLVATATTDGAYTGTKESDPFTLAEAYDLAVQPANDFSKDKLASVTVGEGDAATTIYPDANGKGTINNVAPGQKVTITAKGPDYIIRGAKVKKGIARTASQATADDNGKMIGADGNIYDDAAAATAAGTVAVAKIAYVGSDNGEAAPYNHGLALALRDAGNGSNFIWKTSATDAGHTKQTSSSFTSESGLEYNDATHNSDTYPAFKAAIANNGTAAPSGCSAWFLASGYQWAKMFTAAGGAATLKTNAGMQQYFYWSSSECGGDSAWYYSFPGDYWSTNYKDDGVIHVRSCIAF
jgi:hypothetical protein